jgi:3-deoxy-manno-octulosonate cytidylyltransferase (CMP-KDO synthetase)
MVQHVYERAVESGAREVVIATDDQRVWEICQKFDADVSMTSQAHRSGSDRIAEVVKQRNWDENEIVVNLQGDEPCMPAELLAQVAWDMDQHHSAVVTTLSAPICDRTMLFDPHVVKVVTDQEGFALFFSRAPIPWHRDEFIHADTPLPIDVGFSKHIGLYAYRAGYLARFVALAHAPLERAESLEQLRVLWHGDKIHVSPAERDPGHGVDTRDDLRKVAALLA